MLQGHRCIRTCMPQGRWQAGLKHCFQRLRCSRLGDGRRVCTRRSRRFFSTFLTTVVAAPSPLRFLWPFPPNVQPGRRGVGGASEAPIPDSSVPRHMGRGATHLSGETDMAKLWLVGFGSWFRNGGSRASTYHFQRFGVLCHLLGIRLPIGVKLQTRASKGDEAMRGNRSPGNQTPNRIIGVKLQMCASKGGEAMRGNWS